jgi:hypothetical protein
VLEAEPSEEDGGRQQHSGGGGRTVSKPCVARRRVPGRRDDGKKRRRRTMESDRCLPDRYVERYNAGDLGGVMELYAEDSTQLMPDGTFKGRSEIHVAAQLGLVSHDVPTAV